MKSLIQHASGRACPQVRQPASVLKAILFSLCVLSGTSAGFGQTVFNNGCVNIITGSSPIVYTDVAIGDTVGKTHVFVSGLDVEASGMFRLGRGSFAGALPPPTPAALAPFPDFCSLVLANSASLEITGSGHLCLGGVTGSGNEVIVHSGSTLVTPRIHLGGMQARATTSPDLTDDNRVLVTGAGSTLTVGNAGLLIAWPTVGTITDLPVYRNNLTIVDGATATVNGPINISSHGSDPITGTVRENNIRIGSGSSLSWSGQTSAAALQSLVDRGYILFKDNYIETVYGPPGLLNEPSVRWLTETQVISGTVGSVSVTFDAGTGIATVSYTEY